MFAPSLEVVINHCCVHKCQVRKNYIWFNNYYEASIIGINLSDYHDRIMLTHPAIDRPRGIAISTDGIMAVANHNRDSVMIFDLDSLL